MSNISDISQSITPEPRSLVVQMYDNPQLTMNISQNGAPFDITSYASVQILLKANAGDSDTAGTTTKFSTLTSGITITNAPLGQCAVVFPAFTTIGQYTYWRADLVDHSGNIFTVMYGSFEIEAN